MGENTILREANNQKTQERWEMTDQKEGAETVEREPHRSRERTNRTDKEA